MTFVLTCTAVKASPDHPVLVDSYIIGRECEVDAISDGKDVLIPGIMEHIERAGFTQGTQWRFTHHKLFLRKSKRLSLITRNVWLSVLTVSV